LVNSIGDMFISPGIYNEFVKNVKKTAETYLWNKRIDFVKNMINCQQ
jgi:hypothetical protein